MYTFIKQHSNQLQSTSRLCKALKLSRSAYYTLLNHQPSQRACANVALDQIIRQLYLECHGFVGYRMMRALLLEAKPQVSLGRVRRRMRVLGVMGRQFKRKCYTTNSKHSLGYSTNLLQQDFYVNEANQVWVGDITYIHVQHRWMYLATVIDLYARKVVGWAMDTDMKTALVRSAFDMAMQHRGRPQGVVFHSDHGSQYAAHEFRLQLALTRTAQSMSAKGCCDDNAVAESFFKTLKQPVPIACLAHLNWLKLLCFSSSRLFIMSVDRILLMTIYHPTKRSVYTFKILILRQLRTS